MKKFDMKHMTCEEFFDRINDQMMNYMDKLVWEGRKYSNHLAVEMLFELARRYGVELIDADDFDYEAFFDSVWQSGEWSLS